MRESRVTQRGWIELAAALVYIGCFLIWYPPVFAIIDESVYLSTAYVYRAGTIFNDVAGVENISRVGSGGHDVSKFAPLWPAFLSLFTWAGWRAAFLANLVLVLVGFAIFARLIRRAGLPGWAALLYLGHPTLVYYSRTLMSDVAAGVLFLAAWSCSREDRRGSAILAGLWAGLSCAVRYTNVVLAVLLVAATALEERRRRSKPTERTVPMILGMVGPALALAAYNQVAFGVWWRGIEGYRGELPGLGGQFSPAVVPGGLGHYALALLTVFPLMLLAAVLYRGRDRVVLSVPSFGFTLFFCFYYYQDRSTDFVRTAVVGLRFLIPVLPLFVFAYADGLDRVLRAAKVPPRGATLGVAVATLLSTVLLSMLHEAYLERIDADRRWLYSSTTDGSTILCDTAARKLLHDVWGERHPVRVEFRGRWEFPHAGDIPRGNVFVAMAGRGAGERPPAPLARFLSDREAQPAAAEGAGSRLRLWRIPRPPAQ